MEVQEAGEKKIRKVIRRSKVRKVTHGYNLLVEVYFVALSVGVVQEGPIGVERLCLDWGASRRL